MSDRTNANGQIHNAPATAAQPEPAPQSGPPAQGVPPITATALRLMLGLALEGRDAAATRLSQWELSGRVAPEERAGSGSDEDRARYASIGMMMEAQASIQELLRAMSDVSAEVRGRAGAFAAFMFRQWPFAIFKSRLDDLRFEFEDVLEAWIAVGRREEQLGRQIARQAMASLVEEVFDSMARNPEIRNLIEQQSIGMAETAVEGVRERTASADALVERLVHSVLRRQPPTRGTVASEVTPASPPSQQNG